MDNVLLPLELSDGFCLETVYYESGTLCISTQAGCRMACPFCASGRVGLKRNLSSDELFTQVELHKGNDIKRVTLSGIGEPLDNFEVVKEFIKKSGYPVSVTTSVPDTEKLKELLKLSHNGVMLSFHAGFDETRKKLIPKACQLDEIFHAVSEVWSEISVNKRKKVGFNYMLLDGINDSAEELDAFAGQVTNFKEVTVHLLVCNDVSGSSFKSPSVCVFTDAYELLRNNGLNVRRANNWRKSSNGGCGTLFLKTLQK
ncbi:Radical SAM domain protein [Denitrovibrio acetiphilus DSM 12809]|uniref:Radical SAM domain protein n=2 Tax=Denitrovibrio TaxID=117999 RepID=D4H7E4_DENA2|nr:Radical SAM domain protein [Denitrovibrio acetiphilus DSM 12809]